MTERHQNMAKQHTTTTKRGNTIAKQGKDMTERQIKFIERKSPRESIKRTNEIKDQRGWNAELRQTLLRSTC